MTGKAKYRLINRGGDLVLGTLFLAGITGGMLHRYALIGIGVPLLVLAFSIYLLAATPVVYLYEDGFRIRRFLRDLHRVTLHPYSDISAVHFKYGKGRHLLTIGYNEGTGKRKCVFEFRGRVPEAQLFFLKERGVNIEFIPGTKTIFREGTLH